VSAYISCLYSEGQAARIMHSCLLYSFRSFHLIKDEDYEPFYRAVRMYSGNAWHVAGRYTVRSSFETSAFARLATCLRRKFRSIRSAFIDKIVVTTKVGFLISLCHDNLYSLRRVEFYILRHMGTRVPSSVTVT
jgi:hypothetical protein